MGRIEDLKAKAMAMAIGTSKEEMIALQKELTAKTPLVFSDIRKFYDDKGEPTNIDDLLEALPIWQLTYMSHPDIKRPKELVQELVKSFDKHGITDPYQKYGIIIALMETCIFTPLLAQRINDKKEGNEKKTVADSVDNKPVVQ